MSEMIKPPRTAWGNFPDVLIHASESAVKQHPAYEAAKAGDGNAAIALVSDTMSAAQNQKLAVVLEGHSPTLVSAHAYERGAVNAIPEIFADLLHKVLNWPVDNDIYQANVVFHTGADGFSQVGATGQICRSCEIRCGIRVGRRFRWHGRHAGEHEGLCRIQRRQGACGGLLDREAPFRQTGTFARTLARIEG